MNEWEQFPDQIEGINGGHDLMVFETKIFEGLY